MASDASAWQRFRDTRALTADGLLWWRLLESAQEASPDDVLAFLAAARAVVESPAVWEPMFDPLLFVDGLSSRWEALDEPLRSSLGYGLLRIGRLPSDAMPAGLCERVAASYLDKEEHALSDEELEWQASLWPSGAFRRALMEAALARNDIVPPSVVRFARQGAEPRAAVRLMLDADGFDDEDGERSIAWRLLEDATPAEVAALESLTAEWLNAPDEAPPVPRFRACVALLDRGLFEPEHDVLLPLEMLDWRRDFSPEGCGLCGGEVGPADHVHEPSLGVVLLLSRLPDERRARFLERAMRSEGRRQAAELISAWLREPRGALDAHAAITALPPRARVAVELAWSRLAVASDGQLPRTLQREVIASFWPDPPAETPVSSERVLRNMRDRTLRLVELRAPVQVLLGQASRLRAVERLPATQVEPHLDSVSEQRGWARKTALLRLTLERLGSTDPRVAEVVKSLRALTAGATEAAWPAAEALETEWEARPQDPNAAIGHFAFAALDEATGEGRRTDQDDLGDIAARAFKLSAGAKLGVPPTSPALAEACRGWWQAWLLELVPAAHG